MAEFTPDQVHPFRYWIQGYPNFYEPIVAAFFPLAGYRVVQHPAVVGPADLQRIVDDLFDGRKRLGDELDGKAIRELLKRRKRLQPDFLLEKDGHRYLAELKSWGGYRTGKFDPDTARAEFIANPKNGLFLLVDRLDGVPIAGKLLVVSSACQEPGRVHALLQDAYRTDLEILYLDEIFATPQLGGIIDRQLRYLDAAVAELRQALHGLRSPAEGNVP